jgi:hypothetical protein
VRGNDLRNRRAFGRGEKDVDCGEQRAGGDKRPRGRSWIEKYHGSEEKQNPGREQVGEQENRAAVFSVGDNARIWGEQKKRQGLGDAGDADHFGVAGEFFHHEQKDEVVERIA